MELAKILPSIFKLAKTIHDITKQVKANKNQCQRKCFRNIVKNSIRLFFIKIEQAEGVLATSLGATAEPPELSSRPQPRPELVPKLEANLGT
jgi:conjugal transfer/entry exclusion protein